MRAPRDAPQHNSHQVAYEEKIFLDPQGSLHHQASSLFYIDEDEETLIRQGEVYIVPLPGAKMKMSELQPGGTRGRKWGGGTGRES